MYLFLKIFYDLVRQINRTTNTTSNNNRPQSRKISQDVETANVQRHGNAPPTGDKSKSHKFSRKHHGDNKCILL